MACSHADAGGQGDAEDIRELLACLIARKRELKNGDDAELVLRDAGEAEDEKELVSEALAALRKRLEDTGNCDKRREGIDALEAPVAEELGLFRDKAWYPSYKASDNAGFLEAAIAQLRLMRAEEALASSGGNATLVAGRPGETNPAVSVVVPVYNVENHIVETIGSLCAQTLGDIEIICVDDGSSDGSRDRLVRCAQEDSRILVYGQENKGVSAARNAGMSVARGRYLSFVDSDDRLVPEAYERLVCRAEADELDLLAFDAKTIFLNDEIARQNSDYANYYERSREYSDIVPGPKLVSAMVASGDYKPSPCLYLLRRSLIEGEGMSFHPAVIHEDNGFTFAAYMSARRAAHVKEPFYLRFMRDNSIMTKPKSFANVYGYYVCGVDMMRMLCDSAPDLEPETFQSALSLIYGVQRAARHTYFSLPWYAKGALLAMPNADREAFVKCMDADSVSFAARDRLRERDRKIREGEKSLAASERRVEKLEEKIEGLERRIEGLENSTSYRVGRVITAPGRKAKAAIRRNA